MTIDQKIEGTEEQEPIRQTNEEPEYIAIEIVVGPYDIDRVAIGEGLAKLYDKAEQKEVLEAPIMKLIEEILNNEFAYEEDERKREEILNLANQGAVYHVNGKKIGPEVKLQDLIREVTIEEEGEKIKIKYVRINLIKPQEGGGYKLFIG